LNSLDAVSMDMRCAFPDSRIPIALHSHSTRPAYSTNGVAQ
jgi:hypothetical protein